MLSIPSPTGTARSTPRQGFTLVELLVSITIIVILASLVLVVTQKVRLNAQQVNAVSSMRQIGMANVAYSSENNGFINVIRDAGEWGSGFEGAGNKYASNSFVGRMQPYLFATIDAQNEKELGTRMEEQYASILNTTDIETMAGTPFKGAPVYSDGSGISNPIAVNLKLRPVWREAPLRMSAVRDASSILYLAFGRYYFDVPQITEYTPMPLPGERRRAVYFLPDRKGIFCFLDGHVELIPPPIADRFLE